jgi:uncharacterized protein
MTRKPKRTSAVVERFGALPWQRIGEELDARGFATTGPVLTAAECRALAAAYADDRRFRKTVVMQQHAYGRGEYRYFQYPLPDIVQKMREAFYAPLAAIANHWQELLGEETRFPPSLVGWLRRCHAGGQKRPTPLLLSYGSDDFNCLHRDLYGALVFPLQLTVLLDAPGRDFTGGEFALVEQRPRQQSVVEVVPLQQGEAVIFAVNRRPARGSRGIYRAALRHGVSRVRSGSRRTLGIIFHDAA